MYKKIKLIVFLFMMCWIYLQIKVEHDLVSQEISNKIYNHGSTNLSNGLIQIINVITCPYKVRE